MAGDAAGAEAASRTALAEDPRNVVVRRQLAVLLTRKGDTAGAESILREGRVTQPADPLLQGTLVAVVRQARGLDAALTLADQLARRPEACSTIPKNSRPRNFTNGLTMMLVCSSLNPGSIMPELFWAASVAW